MREYTEANVGRSFGIMPSGVIDLEEDFESGYAGKKLCDTLEEAGITALFPDLYPQKS